MERDKSVPEILKAVLKNFAVKPTITFLSKEVGLSRVGVWKSLKKMQSEKLIFLSRIGSGKTSIYVISLNWDNPLVEKNLALSLTEEALKHQRWLNNFSELDKKVDFLILYGSIISTPQEANDIDVLGAVSRKGRFIEIEESVKKLQKTQTKRIHSINFTQKELRNELRKPNRAFVDAIRKGVVLFGQERFVRFIRGVGANESG